MGDASRRTALIAGLVPVALIVAGGALGARIQDALAGGETAAELNAVYWAFAVVMALFVAREAERVELVVDTRDLHFSDLETGQRIE